MSEDRLRSIGTPWLPLEYRIVLWPLRGAVRRHAVRALTRRLIERVARTVESVAALRAAPDGALVRVAGRVGGRELLRGRLSGARGVWRRVDFTLQDGDGRGPQAHFVEEVGVDFDLLDPQGGARARVVVEGAYLLSRARPLLPQAPVEALPLLALSASERGRRWSYDARLDAAEILIAPDAELVVVGRKSSEIDPGGERMGRETPLQIRLGSTWRRPMLLLPPGFVA